MELVRNIESGIATTLSNYRKKGEFISLFSIWILFVNRNELLFELTYLNSKFQIASVFSEHLNSFMVVDYESHTMYI